MSKTKLGILGLFMGLAVVSGTWFVLHTKAQSGTGSAPAETLSAEDRAALKQALDALGVALNQLQANINTPQSGLVLTADRQAGINSTLGGLEVALTGLDFALSKAGGAVAVQSPAVQAEEKSEGGEPTALAEQNETESLGLLTENQTAQASASADGFSWSKVLLAVFLVVAGGAGLAFYFRLRRKEVKEAPAAPTEPIIDIP